MSIETIEVRPERKTQSKARLTPEELTSYRRATGALLWSTGQMMPYLDCAAVILARRFTCAMVHDLTAANRVTAAAKFACPLPLTYTRLRGLQRLRLFVDASSVKQRYLRRAQGWLLLPLWNLSRPARSRLTLPWLCCNTAPIGSAMSHTPPSLRMSTPC